MNTILTLSHSRDISFDKQQYDFALLQADQSDLYQLAKIHAQEFNNDLQESQQTLDYLINNEDNPNNIIWKLVNQSNNEIVAIASSSFNYHEIYLADVAVKSNYQDQGIGQQLMTNLIYQTRIVYNRPHIYLKLRMANKKALHIYTKLGFKLVDIYEISPTHQQWLEAS